MFDVWRVLPCAAVWFHGTLAGLLTVRLKGLSEIVVVGSTFAAQTSARDPSPITIVGILVRKRLHLVK